MKVISLIGIIALLSTTGGTAYYFYDKAEKLENEKQEIIKLHKLETSVLNNNINLEKQNSLIKQKELAGVIVDLRKQILDLRKEQLKTLESRLVEIDKEKKESEEKMLKDIQEAQARNNLKRNH